MYSSLPLTSLFGGFTPDEIRALLEEAGCELRQAAPGDIVALKGAACHSLMLLAEGTVRCEVPVRGGESAPMERLYAPGVIAPGLLFAPDSRFPAHWVAQTPAAILAVKKKDWTALLQKERRLLENFLTLISDTAKPLSDRVVYRTFRTIRAKLSHYLLELSEQTGSDAFRMPLTQRELADLFGVTRPALARTMGEMSDEGAIYIERKQVRILFPEKLRHYTG